jgi:Ca2+-dependent lipid-binding protein
VNPYVRLSYGDIKQHSSVARRSLLPLWNESFIFPFQEFCNLKMTVYNKVAFGRDEIVGKSSLPCHRCLININKTH